MKTLRVLAGLLALALVAGGCPDKKPGGDEPKKTDPNTPPVTKKDDTKPPAAGALAADTDYASGNTQAAAMEVETKLDVAGLAQEGKADDDVKKAQEGSVTTQSLAVTDNRGKLTFTTEGFFIPKGTELRYNPAQKKYVLADVAKKQYWAMAGSEIVTSSRAAPRRPAPITRSRSRTRRRRRPWPGSRR